MNDKQDNKKKNKEKISLVRLFRSRTLKRYHRSSQQSTYIIINKSDNTAGMVQIWSVWFPLTTLDTS